MKELSVYQFKITLLGINPAIWRRIQVPSVYTFWDLHVAIQSAMGWYDYHLHEFIVKDLIHGEEESIGIPEDEEDPYTELLAGWKIKIEKYLNKNPKIKYIYNYRDYWQHEIQFEGEYPKLEGMEYPICLGGKRACPPEDIGGVSGYENFLKARKNSNKKEDKVDVVNEFFDPENFDPKQVIFWDPVEHRELIITELKY